MREARHPHPISSTERNEPGSSVRVVTVAFPPRDVLTRVRDLLDAAFGGEFSDEDWDHSLGGWHVIVTHGSVPISHAAVVRRVLAIGDRHYQSGYVEAVATAPDRQGEGHATYAMSKIGILLRDRFDIGALSTSRHAFYQRLGWERWRGPTFVRYDSGLIRTEVEDDGIMVLRFGRSSGVDLAQSMTCEARRGDDW